MTPHLLELRNVPSERGGLLTIPIVDSLTIGVSSDADWRLPAASGAIGYVLLEALGPHVRIEPRDGAIVMRKGRRMTRARLLKAPVRFRYGGMEFDAVLAADVRGLEQPVGQASAAADFEAVRAGRDVAGIVDHAQTGRRVQRASDSPRRFGLPRPRLVTVLTCVCGIGLMGGAVAVIGPAAGGGGAPARQSSFDGLHREPLVVAPRQTMPEPSAHRPELPPPVHSGTLRSDVDALLRRAGLESEVSTSVVGGRVFIDGRLEADELRRLAGVLRRATQDDARYAAVESRVERLDDSLPFGVEQVVAGPRPFVVLSDGRRVEIGSTHRGYRLLEVTDSKIVWQGARRLELDW